MTKLYKYQQEAVQRINQFGGRGWTDLQVKKSFTEIRDVLKG